ncbi:MAG: FAD-dependent oxidoreductase [Acidobacteria bacterium]|nr:FAD-dependent oxidoreductase [Acidobacteriota bacterium]
MEQQAVNYQDNATAEVIIIGAGIAGASIAWHLTEAGCKDVLLLERESSQGKGSTGKSMGGVRAQFATDVNIRMSLYAIPFFAQFEERLGQYSGYKPHGYLFCATQQRHLDYLRTNLGRHRALGLQGAEEVTPADISRMVPPWRVDDVLGGTYCPTDGFVDPHAVMSGFTEAALARGARIVRQCEVTAIEKGRVSTTQGTFSAPHIVIACGAWSAGVAALAGAQLPVTPLRRMLVPTEPCSAIPERCPMTIDMGTGFHFRPEGRGLLMAWNDPEETPGFKTAFDPAFIEKILIRAVERVPIFETLEVNSKRAWAGLYEVSPDHHAILGPSAEHDWLYYATGFSGHGVMHSPATGKVLADLITRGTTDLIDAQVLNVRRFAEGRAIHETAVL